MRQLDEKTSVFGGFYLGNEARHWIEACKPCHEERTNWEFLIHAIRVAFIPQAANLSVFSNRGGFAVVAISLDMIKLLTNRAFLAQFSLTA